MALIEQIIEWAKNRPAWERDLIRRVFQNGDLNSNDKKDLIDLIKKEHGLIDESGIIVKPIEEYLPPESESVKKKIHIEKLHRIKNVNRLKVGEVLSFSKNGLTIVYGENASGKSGYSRILKRACRARHSGRILPNVYEENNHTAIAEAVFEIECDGTQMSEIWHDVDKPSTTLTCISVFDKHCARIYVNEKNQIDYLPYGADILPKLIDSIEEFKHHFERNEKSTLPPLAEELLNALPELGFENLEDLLQKENYKRLQELANLTDEEKKKINSLKETLLQRQANSPEKRVADMTRFKTRLTSLKTSLEKLRLSLSDTKIEEISKIYQSYLEAKKAAEVASKTSFSSEPLDGIGSETWRLMFEAARKYSESEGYKAVPFPVIDENSRCVLCQQELSETAKARLKRFDDFVKDETSKKAKDAKTNIEEAYRDISELHFDVLPSDSEIENDLTQNYPDLKEKISEFVQSSKARAEALKKYFKENDDLKLPEFVNQDVIEMIAKEIQGIEKKIGDCKSSQKSKEEAEEEKAYKILNDRQIVVKNLSSLEKHLGVLKENKKVQKCIDSLNTRAITSKQKELLKETVTNRLFAQLQQELKDLGVENVELESVEEGEKGSISLQISLKGVKTVVKELADVLSEGEERMVAIAAFLAELKIYEHLSCIVFDDPVSSLDHKWRTKVAERIVRESKERQVIVFTHDLVFLLDLQSAADKEEIQNVNIQALESTNNASGLVAEKPFAVSNTKGQIGMLKEMQQKSSSVQSEGSEKYNEYIERCYSRLRSAWERCVEEVVLNHTVSRFRYGIETKRLKDVATKLTEDDYNTIDVAMTKCSSITDAHDTAPAARGSIPSPDDLNTDIKSLESFVSSFRSRK